MTLSRTARIELPLLAVGQSHKELFHNEALARLDFVLHPHVQAIESDPSSLVPENGQSWLVGADATDAWAGREDQIAGWTGNGWLFIAPLAFMRVFVESIDSFATYREAWQLNDAVTSPSGGSVIDTESRFAIDSLLAALQEQGILKPGL